jgi:hypothetical protein
VIGSAPVGVLSDDLRQACLKALELSRLDCLSFAASHTWEASARAFVNNISSMRAEIGSKAQVTSKHPRFAA